MNSLFTSSLPVKTGVSTAFSFVFRPFMTAAGLLLSLFPALLNAQTLDWVQPASGPGFQETRSMAVDAGGNVFVIGTFEGTTAFGSGTAGLNSLGFFDAFFAKYDASGNLVWAKGIGGTGGLAFGYGIALDAGGNICIAGNFNGTADFDPGPDTRKLTSAGSFDAFLAKYDPSGNILWANNMGGTLFEEARCMAVDAAGNIAIAGVFSGTADLDPGPDTTAFEAEGSHDAFLAKYDPSGDLLWAKQITGDGVERVLAFTISNSDQLYIAGHFQGSVDFDPSAGENILDVVGDSDLFYARYDGDGNLVWAKTAGGGFFYEEARGIAVDRFDNVYITGRYGDMADFDPGPGVALLDNAGINDAFFAKYDAQGELVWAKKIGDELNDIGNSIAVDTFGRVYLTGQYMITCDLDPGAGTSNLTATGDIEIFLAQYDASGNFLWAKSIGGMQMEESTVVALDAQQNIYVGGFFKGNADFDPGPGAANLTSVGKEDGFVAKFTAPVTATHDVSLLDTRVYPVPAVDVLNIVLPGHAGEFHCAVFDAAGRMVMERQGEGEKLAVDLSGFGSGVYFLRIRTEQGVRSVGVEVMR